MRNGGSSNRVLAAFGCRMLVGVQLHAYELPMETTPAQVIDECACIRVRRASRAVTRAFDDAVRPLGIKATQFALLVAVSARKSASTTEHADRLGMERTTMVRNLQLLEKQGFLTSQIAGGKRVPSLTDYGLETLASALPRWRMAQDRLKASMGHGQWPGILSNLDTLHQKA